MFSFVLINIAVEYDADVGIVCHCCRCCCFVVSDAVFVACDNSVVFVVAVVTLLIIVVVIVVVVVIGGGGNAACVDVSCFVGSGSVVVIDFVLVVIWLYFLLLNP